MKNLEDNKQISDIIINCNRADPEHRQSDNEFFRLIAEKMSDTVYLTDGVGFISYISPAVEKMFGFLPEEMSGRHFSEFLAEGEQLKAMQAFTNAVEKGEPTRNIELRMKRKDGSIFPGELQGNRFFQNDSAWTLGVIRDITEQKENEEKLRKSENMYKSLFENMLNGFAYCKMVYEDEKPADFIYLKVNNAFESLTGLKEVEGKRVTEVIPDIRHSDTELFRIYGRVAQSGNPEKFEMFVKALNMWFSVSVYSPEKEYFIAIFEVITDRMNAKTELEKQKNFFEQLFSQSSISTQILDKDGWCERINPKLSEIFGVKPEHIEGRVYNIFKDEGIKQGGVLPHLEKVFKEGKTAEWEVHFDIGIAAESQNIEVKEKKKVWYSNWSFPIFDENGNLSHVIIQHTDITNRKNAEDALKESEQKYRGLFENSVTGIYQTLPDGKLIGVNSAFAKMFGYSSAEEIIDAISDIGKEIYYDAQERSKIISIMNETGSVGPLELRVKHRNGHPFWVIISARAVKDTQGNIINYEGIAVDITQQKFAEEEREKLRAQLQQAQKMESVGRLAGGVAHDFNNMLSVIIGNAEMAMGQLSTASELHEELREIHSAAEKSANLTRQLLAFARKQTIAPVVLDLNETVGGALKMMKRLVGENIEVDWHPGENLWKISMDPSQVDQIIANLLVNARDAIPGNGSVILETHNIQGDKIFLSKPLKEIEGEFVMLSISDSGSGMSKETQEHLFEPFFTTKDLGKGTGLGLATVYGIVKQNNGYIDVYSEPGRGTTFKIYLPREKSLKGTETKKKIEISGLIGTETILLLEDEESILSMGAKMLEKLGYKVLKASKPSQALNIVKDYPGTIHLLITDLILPEMTGHEISLLIKSINPDIKSLFMSGYSADVVSSQGIARTGAGFIQKPFSMEDLGTKVRYALAT